MAMEGWTSVGGQDGGHCFGKGKKQQLKPAVLNSYMCLRGALDVALYLKVLILIEGLNSCYKHALKGENCAF